MGTRTILFLSACCIVQCAANQCSDSFGTCNSPARASLMQTRSLKAKALSAVEASASRTETLKAYKEYATDLAEKYKQQPDMEDQLNNEDSEISKAIDTILQYIKAMYDDLKRWHDEDVESSKSCAPTTVIDTCEANYLNSVQVAEIENKMALVQPAREKHIQCRDRCSKCQMSDSCKEYHQYRHNNPDALFEDVVSCADPALSDEYIKTTDSKELEKMESCLNDAKTWLDPLYKLYKACEWDSEFCPTCSTTCKDDQVDFENKHCQVDAVRDSHCWAFRRCYDDKHKDCAQDCLDIEVRSKARGADNETGELIKCLLDVLKTNDVQDNDGDEAGGKSAKLAECNTNSYASDFWIIECIGSGPECPEVLHPCEDTAQPCNQEFLNEEYHNKEGRNLNLRTYTDEVAYHDSTDMIGKCTGCGYIPQEWCPGRGDYAGLTDAALGQ